MTRVTDLHERWMDEPEYAEAYAELETEFALAREMIEARARAGLTQDELASRMDTSRTVIARLESGRSLPSTRTLKRFAAATGSRLAISFVPASKKARKERTAKRAASA
ncbi:helix-turn-helix transcriptional regulator [Rhodomicrobium lacus]|uniref:helix-turn-helix transcriptional regulator n=2 Tax=Rhodomicrobium TaxID=1068 RepID=UPI000F8DD49C|nr:helix-turn-helix transcriptional regulator [Rhodomicrobium lacus]